MNDSLFLYGSLLCAAIAIAVVNMPTSNQPAEHVKLGKAVRAENMAKICFPDGVYVQAAHPYCKKFKEDLFEHLNKRERDHAEKCIRDGVKVSKCVRLK